MMQAKEHYYNISCSKDNLTSISWHNFSTLFLGFSRSFQELLEVSKSLTTSQKSKFASIRNVDLKNARSTCNPLLFSYTTFSA